MRSWVPLLVILAASLSSCAGDDASEELRVLFVGNSLTYYNDLPGMVAALNGAIAGARPLETDMLASGGASIRDHLGDDALRRAVSEFDVVVLQDVGGWPLCPPADERCAGSVSSIRKAVALARAAGARPLWYSTYQLMPCRTPWQGADLTRQKLASEQASPPVDCSVPTADQLRRAIAAANAVATETLQ